MSHPVSRLCGHYKVRGQLWFYVTGYLDEESIRSLTSHNQLKNAWLSPTVEFLRVFFPHQMESMSNGGILCAEERQNIIIIIIVVVIIVTKTDDLSQ